MITPAETQHFNWIDFTILGIVGFSAVISFFRGFIRESISLVAWSLGFYLALRYAMLLQVELTEWIPSESMRYFVSFVGLFLCVVIVGMLLNILVHTIITKAGLSLTDRFLGVFFGALRGLVIVGVVLVLLMNMGSVSDSVALTQSKLAGQFKPMVLWLNTYLPDKMKVIGEWVEGDLPVKQDKI